MRGLKALVIGMGVLIVAGVVFLIYAIIDKAGEKTAAGRSGLQAEVALPAGAEVVETSIGDGTIVLRLRLGDGSGRLLVIDPATGKSLGRIDLKVQ
tara:strand:- start:2473 stop:2760 length:288 start_codon:yes stop_codon:yes gene_type:complete